MGRPRGKGAGLWYVSIRLDGRRWVQESCGSLGRCAEVLIQGALQRIGVMRGRWVFARVSKVESVVVMLVCVWKIYIYI